MVVMFVLISVNPERPGDLKECFNVYLELIDDTSVRFPLLYFARITFVLRVRSNGVQKLTNELVIVVKPLCKTPFTRYNRLSNRFYNRFDNRLYRVNKHPTACQTGCQTGLTTGLTTVLNEQLFV